MFLTGRIRLASSHDGQVLAKRPGVRVLVVELLRGTFALSSRAHHDLSAGAGKWVVSRMGHGRGPRESTAAVALPACQYRHGDVAWRWRRRRAGNAMPPIAFSG